MGIRIGKDRMDIRMVLEDVLFANSDKKLKGMLIEEEQNNMVPTKAIEYVIV